MTVFIDTSALYAALSAGDQNHQAATGCWRDLAARHEVPVTTNYVLVETMALAGRRLGMQAVRDFQTQFVPVLQVHFVDQALHERASAALLTAGDRDLSLVDCISFELMRSHGIDTAFAFDAHFSQQGFRLIP